MNRLVQCVIHPSGKQQQNRGLCAFAFTLFFVQIHDFSHFGTGLGYAPNAPVETVAVALDVDDGLGLKMIRHVHSKSRPVIS